MVYYARKELWVPSNRELVKRGVVTHHSGWVCRHTPPPPPCKYISNVTCQLCTVGYATIPSCGWKAASFKPYSRTDAELFGSEMPPMQELLEAEGEYNIGAHLVVDCTPLFRYHNPEDIHCGENVEDLRAMVNGPDFSNVLFNIKLALDCFLRDGLTGHQFDGLFFDPHGQNRSVALARIVWFCLKRDGVQVVEPVHLSKEKWQDQCCRGECTHCMNAPMSQEKQRLIRFCL